MGDGVIDALDRLKGLDDLEYARFSILEELLNLIVNDDIIGVRMHDGLFLARYRSWPLASRA